MPSDQLKQLRALYKKFLLYECVSLWSVSGKNHDVSGGPRRISFRLYQQFYREYYREPFFSFARNVKLILSTRDPFQMMLARSKGCEDVVNYTSFLMHEGIIAQGKGPLVKVLDRELAALFPPVISHDEICACIETVFGSSYDLRAPVHALFGSRVAKIKKHLDQLPVSLESALFVVEKILYHLPLHGPFLCIGDDDYISILLGIVNPQLNIIVIDADAELLDSLSYFSKRFHLSVQTKSVDVRKTKRLGSHMVGFLCNAPYNEMGVKMFMNYGVDQFGPDGGFAFLETGDEAIGSRFLFLQQFFAKKRLLIEELITRKVYYPYQIIHETDKEYFARMKQLFDEETIISQPGLGAVLYVFRFIPWQPKRISFKVSIYDYL